MLVQAFRSLADFSRVANIRDIGLALAALVGFPFLVWRSWVAAKTARIAEENLTTGLISEALEGLGAEKTVKEAGRERSVPNIEVRIGAIYQLERLARTQAATGTPQGAADHIRILQSLCAYIRENAPARRAVDLNMPDWPDWPENASAEDLAARAALLDARHDELREKIARIRRDHAPRTDIQTALEVIGRRDATQIAVERAATGPGQADGYRLDLRHTNLQAGALSNLNFDRALFTGARMEGADLGAARLAGAHLDAARLEGANLGWARLEGVHLGWARLEGADLRESRLEGADLRGARLEGAALREARLEGAYLRLARLEGADLREARLEGATLRLARLEGAHLGAARLVGADLRMAQLRHAKWARATIAAFLAQFADLRGGSDLDQAQLSSLLGNAATLLPQTPEGQPDLWVPHKWAEEPPGFDPLLATLIRYGASEDEVRAVYLCSPGEVPRKTGTPWPADADPPWGAQGADEDDWVYRQRIEDWAAAQPDRGPVEAAGG